MDKKVGLAIVTYGSNYGTYLQAFATQFIVDKLGENAEVINIDSVQKEVSSARKKYFISRLFDFREVMSYSDRIKGIVYSKINKHYGEYVRNRDNCFDKFRRNEFHFSEVRDSWHGLTELCKERYKAVVVGSDQLWRPANIAGDYYTLNFVPDEINKIAYATSFGLSQIRENQKEISKSFLSRINHLSVREESGKKIVKDLIARDIPVVCDPTLLLTSEEWGARAGNQPIIKDDYILFYMLGASVEHRNFVKELSKKTGYKIVGVLHVAGYIRVDEGFADQEPRDIGPFEFLNLVKNAKYVCTDSFHGCVFSIIFNRPLFAFKRFSDKDSMSTNSRVVTLLEWTGLQDRLVSGMESVDECITMQSDYTLVNERLAKKRANSIQYLVDALEDKETDIGL